MKIGYSENPICRLAELQTGNDGELYLCGAIPARGVSNERHVHAVLEPYNKRGEWFFIHSCVLDLYSAVELIESHMPSGYRRIPPYLSAEHLSV